MKKINKTHKKALKNVYKRLLQRFKSLCWTNPKHTKTDMYCKETSNFAPKNVRMIHSRAETAKYRIRKLYAVFVMENSTLIVFCVNLRQYA